MKKVRFGRFAPYVVILLLAGYVLATNPVLALVCVLVVLGGAILALVVLGTVRALRGLKKKLSSLPYIAREENWASPSEVKKLLRKANRLELLLLGTTPEQECARREHYRGTQLPKLIVPFANQALYSEFKGLTFWLAFFGFPEEVEMTQEELAFLSSALDKLEQRFGQQQQRTQKQQKQLCHSLNVLMQECEALKQTRMTVPLCEEYHRLVAVIDVLMKMVDAPSCPIDLIQGYVREFQHDMERLLLEIQGLHAVR